MLDWDYSKSPNMSLEPKSRSMLSVDGRFSSMLRELLFTCSFGAWLEQPSFGAKCKIEVCLISCVSCWLDLFFKDFWYKATRCLGPRQFLAKCEKSPHLWHLLSFLDFTLSFFLLFELGLLSHIVFAFTSFVLWKRSIELIPSIFLYVVNLMQRRQTNRALMMILQKKFIMFFCLSQCMNKLGIKLVIMSPILLL